MQSGESLALDRAYVRDQALPLHCRLVATSFVVNVVGKARARRLLFGDAPSGLPPAAGGSRRA